MFAGEVIRVAEAVGTDGILGQSTSLAPSTELTGCAGGQAYVPGVSGTWKTLTGAWM
jgi:hypothetical protein